MTAGRTLGSVLKLALLGVLVVLVVGQLLGQPILFTFVETDSMEPTLQPGDGFVAIPTALHGQPSPGDVVVYRSQGIDRGGLVTHRITGKTDEGYITRGDANPFPDQDSGEPPVPESRIVATALTINGDVVVIPGLETAVTAVRSAVQTVQSQLSMMLGTRVLLGTRGIGLLLLGIGIVSIAISAVLGSVRHSVRRNERDRSRPVVSAWTVVLVLALLVSGPALGAMVLTDGVQTYSFVSSGSGTDSPSVLQSGTQETITYNLTNSDPFTAIVVFEPRDEGITIEPSVVRLPPGETVSTTVTVTVPEEIGYYELSIVESRYFAVFPTSVTTSLHAISSVLALLCVTAVFFLGTALLSVVLVGTSPLRFRWESQKESLMVRLWRLL